MSTIAELSQDLVNRLLDIPELDGAVSLSIVDDPQSTNYKRIPIPFAGVRLAAESNQNDSPLSRKTQPIQTVFAVSLHVKNGSDDILNNESFPFLDKVRKAIEGETASPGSFAWQFVNARAAFMDTSRIQYIQYYSVITPK